MIIDCIVLWAFSLYLGWSLSTAMWKNGYYSPKGLLVAISFLLLVHLFVIIPTRAAVLLITGHPELNIITSGIFMYAWYSNKDYVGEKLHKRVVKWFGS